MSMNAMKLTLEEMEMVNGGSDVVGTLTKIYDLFHRLKDSNSSDPNHQ